MKKRISVVMADPSEDFRKLVGDILCAEDDILLMAAVDNGVDALRSVRSLRPDVLLCDLMLRGMDGISLVRKLNEEGIRPRTVVVSAFCSDLQMGLATELGVDCFIPKPCRIERILESIRECGAGCAAADEKRAVVIRQLAAAQITRAEGVMQGIGMLPYFSGYKYLVAAFAEILADREMLLGVTKVLYPKLAEKFGTSPNGIERCIRSALDYAWREENRETREAFLACEMNLVMPDKPGNVKFMKTVLEYIDRKAVSQCR